MTKRISNTRYGGLDDAEVYRVCNLLMAVAGVFPVSDEFEERRAAAWLPHEIAVQLARVDTRTPLSDALYAFAAAIDLYVHFRASIGPGIGDFRQVLDQAMKD